MNLIYILHHIIYIHLQLIIIEHLIIIKIPEIIIFAVYIKNTDAETLIFENPDKYTKYFRKNINNIDIYNIYNIFEKICQSNLINNSFFNNELTDQYVIY